MMRPIDLIVIHCAATNNGSSHDVKDIDAWHRKRGWAGCGYHIVIPVTGEIQVGRPLARPGAHAQGHNQYSIGICLIGTNKYTPPQWASLRAALQTLMLVYPGIDVLGHRDLPNVAKTCPGFDVRDWLRDGMRMPEGHIHV